MGKSQIIDTPTLSSQQEDNTLNVLDPWSPLDITALKQHLGSIKSGSPRSSPHFNNATVGAASPYHNHGSSESLFTRGYSSLQLETCNGFTFT